MYSTLSMTFGGWISFIIARCFFGQPLAIKLNNQWVRKVQGEFHQNGWKFVAFARINPVIPTTPLNYLLGLTSLSHKGFIITTFIFLLLPAISIAYVGDIFQTMTVQSIDAKNVVKKILLFSGAITIVLLSIFIVNIIKKGNEKK